MKLKRFRRCLPGLIQIILTSVSFFILIAALSVGFPPLLAAEDMGGFLMGSYPTALPLSKGRLEVGLDYQIINDTVDVLGVREDEYEKLSSTDRAATPGDLWGARLSVNYGLFTGTTLMSAFKYRSLDYGFDSLGIKTLDLSLKQRLFSGNNLWFAGLALDAGLRVNWADETRYDDQQEINAVIQRISPGTRASIRIDSNYVWFEKTNSNGDRFALGMQRYGRPDPLVSIGDSQDFSPYLRLTGGWIWGRFRPNLFVEGGHTEINSQVDTTLTSYIPDAYRDALPDFPIDLSRSENYIKTGASLFVRLPYGLSLHLEYDYLKLFRDDQLGYMDDNTIIKADIVHSLTPALMLRVGGIYFERQLNGEIPFLYNEFTQTTFDHPYGYAHIGLTYLFGVR